MTRSWFDPWLGELEWDWPAKADDRRPFNWQLDTVGCLGWSVGAPPALRPQTWMESEYPETVEVPTYEIVEAEVVLTTETYLWDST